MNKWVFMLISLLFVLVGCEETEARENKKVVEERFFEQIKTQMKEENISSFLDSEVELIQVRSHKLETLIFLEFYVKAKLNENFETLSDSEKYEVLGYLDGYEYDFDEFCGDGYSCRVDTITLFDNKDEYEVSPTLGFSVDKNGEYFNPDPPNIDYSNNKDSTSEVDEQAVYDYMKAQYDYLTNYGENYIPEEHDPLVAEMASQKFGISASEAGRIYEKIEMRGF